MKKLLFLLLLIPFLGTSQGTFTAPVGYNTGAPTAAPSGVGTRWRFDLLTGKKYTWNPDAVAWDEDPRGIDQISGCSAPLYTPGYNQSIFAVNGCTSGQGGPKLYLYNGSTWDCLNCASGPTYTAGTGIAISGGNVISNTGDLSATNEIQTLSMLDDQLSLSLGGGTVTIPVYDQSFLGREFANGGGYGFIPHSTYAQVDSFGSFYIGKFPFEYNQNFTTWDYTRQYGFVLDTLSISAVVANQTDPFTGGIKYQNLYQVNDTSIILRQVKAGQFTYIQCVDNKGNIVCSEVTALDTAKVEILISNDSFAVIDDRPGGVGLKYDKDLSANFIDESLITKRWVNNFAKNIFTANDTITTGGRVGIGNGIKSFFLGRIDGTSSTSNPIMSGSDQAFFGVSNRGYSNPIAAGGGGPAFVAYANDSINGFEQRFYMSDGNTGFVNINNGQLPLLQNAGFGVTNGGYLFTTQDEVNAPAGEGLRAASYGNAGLSSLQNSHYDIASGDDYDNGGLFSLSGDPNVYPNGSASLQYQFVGLDDQNYYRDRYVTFVGHNQVVPNSGIDASGPYHVAKSMNSPQIETDMWGVRQLVAKQVGTNYTYDWVNVNFVEDDTTGNKVEFYNRKYALPNAAPGMGEKIITWINGVPDFEIKGVLTNLTASQISAISSPVTGQMVFCTDCTATDSSTGVQQVWNGSSWKNAW